MTTRTKQVETKPWEQQEGASRQAFEAFARYRDMGPDRSLRKVEQQLNKSHTLIGRWSGVHDWVKRAELYDQEMDRVALREQEKARKEMGERQARIAMVFQNKVVDRLRSLDPGELSPSDLAKWLDIAVKTCNPTRSHSFANLRVCVNACNTRRIAPRDTVSNRIQSTNQGLQPKERSSRNSS